ncbi:MAG: glucuronate isomerase, partial [Armatimonadetes bacterium]|nr:glucuronate isomerase [Armatimonadota bacterium]
MSSAPLRTAEAVRATVAEAVSSTPIQDVHTHLYSPCFGGLLLYGIDELVTYHYLIAEVHRADLTLRPEQFYAMPKQAQADLIWRRLFVEHLPISEATRGVLTVLQALDIEPGSDAPAAARTKLAGYSVEQYIDLIFRAANVAGAVMTNDPFDDAERAVWLSGAKLDPRFTAALRIDYLLLRWPEAWPRLREWGYRVGERLDDACLAEVRRFLTDWIERMDPVYMAASLSSDFTLPAATSAARLTEQAVVPVSRERQVPFAVMPGVKRLINPALTLAGDGVGRCDLGWLEYLCRTYPDNRFLATVLSRENQHELCVIARKFSNLMPFGCWWFLNNPVLIEEMTRMRLELLGTSVIPQHSDARILDQLIYKWHHTRGILAKVLTDKYADLQETGLRVTPQMIQRDVSLLLRDNY